MLNLSFVKKTSNYHTRIIRASQFSNYILFVINKLPVKLARKCTLIPCVAVFRKLCSRGQNSNLGPPAYRANALPVDLPEPPGGRENIPVLLQRDIATTLANVSYRVLSSHQPGFCPGGVQGWPVGMIMEQVVNKWWSRQLSPYLPLYFYCIKISSNKENML